MNAIHFQPLYQERVWGGRALEERLGRKLPENEVIGESWEIVDRPEAQSVITGGTFDGLTLRDAIQRSAKEIMGPSWDKDATFPILVKWLDCKERLSLQVHPPASVADELKGEPKTENWYIAECDPSAHILCGLKKGVSKEQFEEALRSNELEPLVHKVKVEPGDSMFVWSGRIHAIDAGNLILEIQQNSDTTYRVYDWGRTGLDGKPRQLHIDESLKSIDFEDYEPEITRSEDAELVLADCDEFRIRRIELGGSDTKLDFDAGEEPRILSVVKGTLVDLNTNDVFGRGENVLLPYDGEFQLRADGEATVLITDRFTR